MLEKFDAGFFAGIFVEEAQKEVNGVSFKKGVSSGAGSIPYDTGNLAKSITMTYAMEGTAVVIIGNVEEAFYANWLQENIYVGNTSRPNYHRGFIEKFIVNEYADALRKYGTVTVKGGINLDV